MSPFSLQHLFADTEAGEAGLEVSLYHVAPATEAVDVAAAIAPSKAIHQLKFPDRSEKEEEDDFEEEEEEEERFSSGGRKEGKEEEAAEWVGKLSEKEKF